MPADTTVIIQYPDLSFRELATQIAQKIKEGGVITFPREVGWSFTVVDPKSSVHLVCNNPKE
jgi:hypothetical protein